MLGAQDHRFSLPPLTVKYPPLSKVYKVFSSFSFLNQPPHGVELAGYLTRIRNQSLIPRTDRTTPRSYKMRSTVLLIVTGIVASALAAPLDIVAVNSTAHDFTTRDVETCGKITYYNPSVGTGSCGWDTPDSDYSVALHDVPWGSAECGEIISIRHEGTGNIVTAPVRDSCPVCVRTTGQDRPVADVSPSLFNALGGGDGTFQGCWWYV